MKSNTVAIRFDNRLLNKSVRFTKKISINLKNIVRSLAETPFPASW